MARAPKPTPRQNRADARADRRSKKRSQDHQPLLRLLKDNEARTQPRTVPAKGRTEDVEPLTDNQKLYDAAMKGCGIVFGIGPAGTGKTWFAVQRAVEAFKRGDIERIICTRPAVEAGGSMGFLPGDLDEKFAPYFQPVRDALEEGFGSSYTEYLIKEGKIVIKPLEFIRGSTIDGYVIADEMQNATRAQMKMFLTRIGNKPGTVFVINGDDDQCDLAKPADSGLRDAVNRLKHLKAVGVVEFGVADIVRSGLCQDVVIAYGNKQKPTNVPDVSRYTDDIETDSEDTGLLRMLKAG